MNVVLQNECHPRNTIPIIMWNKRRADDAFAAHKALLLAENSAPELRKNPAWQCLRADAYENFVLAFEAVV